MCFVCCVVVCFAPAAMHIKSLEVTRFCSVVGILAKVVFLHSIPQCWHFLSLISMRGGRSSSVHPFCHTCWGNWHHQAGRQPLSMPCFSFPGIRCIPPSAWTSAVSIEWVSDIHLLLCEAQNITIFSSSSLASTAFHQCRVSIRLGSLSRSVS